MRKLLVIMLVVSLSVVMLTGCTNSAENVEDIGSEQIVTEEESQVITEESEVASEEISETESENSSEEVSEEVIVDYSAENIILHSYGLFFRTQYYFGKIIKLICHISFAVSQSLLSYVSVRY